MTSASWLLNSSFKGSPGPRWVYISHQPPRNDGTTSRPGYLWMLSTRGENTALDAYDLRKQADAVVLVHRHSPISQLLFICCVSSLGHPAVPATLPAFA